MYTETKVDLDENVKIENASGHLLARGQAGWRGKNIWAVAVHPDLHGKGIGELLMLRVIGQCLRSKPKRISLGVMAYKDNPGAHRLYTKVGFQDEGEEHRSFDITPEYIRWRRNRIRVLERRIKKLEEPPQLREWYGSLTEAYCNGRKRTRS